MEQIKQKEAQEEEAPEGFNQKPQDAETFVNVVIKKKRKLDDDGEEN